MNATPVKANPELGFVISKVKLVVPFRGIVAAPNALVMVGGLATMSVAVLLVVPVPPFVDEMALVVLSFWPEVVPVTFTEIVHEPFAAMVPPVRLMLLVPWVAVSVPAHVLACPFGVATIKPETRVSKKATPVSAVAVFGFVSVSVIVEVPFTPIVVRWSEGRSRYR